jgi:hypothetical protein
VSQGRSHPANGRPPADPGKYGLIFHVLEQGYDSKWKKSKSLHSCVMQAGCDDERNSTLSALKNIVTKDIAPRNPNFLCRFPCLYSNSYPIFRIIEIKASEPF